MTLRKGKQKLGRPCRECEKYFLPTGTSGRLCESCILKRKDERIREKLKRKVFKI